MGLFPHERVSFPIPLVLSFDEIFPHSLNESFFPIRMRQVFFLQTCRDQLGKQVFFVNRIDRGTSGLVLMAFDGPTAAKLQIALASEEASKECE